MNKLLSVKDKLRIISASSMSSYEMCPKNWYLHYVVKLIDPPNPAFIIGTAYHKCLEDFHNGKKIDAIIEELKKDLLGDEPTKDAIKRFGIVRKMFEKYLLNPLPGDILEQEYKFTVKVPGVPIPLFGFVDRVDVDKIGENKTTSIDFTQKDIQTIQSLIYTYAIYKEKGKILPVHYTVNNKNKVNKDSYKPQRLVIQYTEEDMKELELKIKKFYEEVTTATSFPHKKGKYPCPWCHL